jgi:HSP20 family protein
MYLLCAHFVSFALIAIQKLRSSDGASYFLNNLKYSHPSSVFPVVTLFFHLKTNKMYYNQASAAKGEHGGRNRHLLYRSMQRAAVNVYKTGNSFEMLLFAPGRIREHFHLDVKGSRLTISYTPPEGFPRPNWVLREYSRGGFVRSFELDDSVDTAAISAKYADGVLEVSMPFKEGRQPQEREITVN